MKAVSPLIASVLLIAFVFSISLIITDWTTSIGKEKSEEIAKKGEKSVKCTFADFTIIKPLLTYNFSSKATINLTIRNSGKEPLYDFKFSVITDKNTLPKSYEFVALNQKTENEPLKPGEFWTFNLIPNGSSPQSGEKLSEIFVSAKCQTDFTISRSLVLEE